MIRKLEELLFFCLISHDNHEQQPKETWTQKKASSWSFKSFCFLLQPNNWIKKCVAHYAEQRRPPGREKSRQRIRRRCLKALRFVTSLGKMFSGINLSSLDLWLSLFYGGIFFSVDKKHSHGGFVRVENG